MIFIFFLDVMDQQEVANRFFCFVFFVMHWHSASSDTPKENTVQPNVFKSHVISKRCLREENENHLCFFLPLQNDTYVCL